MSVNGHAFGCRCCIVPGLERDTTKPGWVLTGITLMLFLIWSNTFIAFEYILGADGSPARFNWLSLTNARFVPVFVLCVLYCFAPSRKDDSIRIWRENWKRLLVCGALAVPGYNFAIYYGQEHGVPAPVASLTTTLAPIFILVLSVVALGEKLTGRKIAGLLLCVLGMTVIASARWDGQSLRYPALIAITSLAPLAWSIFSVLTKPKTKTIDPILWTYLSIIAGAIPSVLMMPWSGGPELLRSDLTGWLCVGYLSVFATVLGFAIWTWLLQYLPASTVGLTIFLNPPLTTTSKLILSALFPATFAFRVLPLEMVGGAVVLVGLAFAVFRDGKKGK